MNRSIWIALLLILGIGLCSNVFAQFDVTIGEGTTANTDTAVPTPYGTYYKNFREQYLVLASELEAQGGGAGNINSVAFYVQAVNTCSPMPNFTIRLKHTTQAALTTTFEVGEYQTVFVQDNFLPVEGWNTHSFSTPFVWDGTSNILVEVVTSLIPGAYTRNASVYYTNNAFYSSLRFQSDTGEASSSTSGTRSLKRSNIRFNMQVPLLPPNDLKGISLTGILTPSATATANYTVTVYNHGSAAQTDYQVKLYRGADIEIASVAGTLIQPNEYLDFTLPWTPATEGTEVLYGKVVLAGDANPANDQTPSLNVSVLPPGALMVTVGSGSSTLRMPLDFFYHNSLNETLYYPVELGIVGNIYAIQLYNNFSTNLLAKPVKIWLGTTNLEDLSAGWIPSTLLTPVFDGLVDFPNGQNTITIPLQTPFPYTGGNLVLMFNRPLDSIYFTNSEYFYGQTIGSNRSRNIYQDNTALDPASPPAGTLSGQFAKTSFMIAPLSPDPIFAVIPGSHDFGTVWLSKYASKSFTMMNTGGGTLTIDSISLPGDPHFSLQGLPALPVILATGEAATFGVRYQPAAAGDHNATITISDSRANHTVELSGNCSDATIYTLPYAQNWDSATPPDLSLGWTSIYQATVANGYVKTVTSYPYSPPNCVIMYNPVDINTIALLIAPPLSTTIPANNVRVRFFGKSGNSYHLLLGVMTDPNDPATFEMVQDLNVGSIWSEYVVSLAGYTGTGRFIAFKHASLASDQSIWVDDVSFELMTPNDLACTALTGNSTPNAGLESIYTASVLNWGTDTQSVYTVKLFDSSDVELASVAGVSIAPDATVEIPIPWTPAAAGPIVLHAKVVLPGDLNPANDRSPNLNLMVMDSGTNLVSIGTDTTANASTSAPTPYGTYFKNFRQQYLYTAAELLAAGATPGFISSLGFEVQALNTCLPMPNYTIRIKSTDQTVLSGTFEPGDYTQVWYQDNFLPQVGWNTHSFGTPIFWDGYSNILVDIVTSLIPVNYTLNAAVFYTTTPVYTCLRYQSDTVDASTSTTGTRSMNRANIRFTLQVDGLAALNGSVSSGGLPVEAVDITLEGTTYHTLTDALGAYSFPYLLPGDYNVTASKLGYISQTLPLSLMADQTATLNFDLVALPLVTVSGLVVGSDQPSIGLADVAITLDGELDYSGNTDAQGQFSIPGVLSGQTYLYTFTKAGYQNLEGNITVGTEDYDLGTLTLTEIALPPVNVQATVAADFSSVLVNWDLPVSFGGEWLHYDSGMYAQGIGTSGVVDQPFTPVLYSYNTVLLNTPVPITGTEELWFGMRCNVTSGLPAGSDAGPAVDGFGNMIYYQSAWSTLTALNSSLNYNWNIQGFVGILPPTPAPAKLTPLAFNAERYNTGILRSSGIKQTKAAANSSSRSSERSLQGYLVWRLLSADQDNQDLWTPLTPSAINSLTYTDTDWQPLAPGVYKFAVKAVYTGEVVSEPAFSNAIEKDMMGILAGTVTESGTNAPIAGATITAGIYSGTSDAAGHYSFPIYQDIYDVSCTSSYYQTAILSGVQIYGNQTTTVDFVLSLAPQAPEAPLALEAANITDGSFLAMWNPVPGATGYYLSVYTGDNAPATDLFFSEYVEGVSNNKALEIFNGTGADIDLSQYTVKLGSNGGYWSPTNILTTSGSLANNDVLVIANPGANTAIFEVADFFSTVTYFNGNDCVGLFHGDTMIDIIGQYQVDPGTAWPVAGTPDATLNHTLLRKPSVTQGNLDWLTGAGTDIDNSEWVVYPQDYIASLGQHSINPVAFVPGYENLLVGNLTSYPVTGLAPNTIYYYVVRAANDYGSGTNSNEVSVQTTGTVPVELSSFTAAQTAANNVQLAWVTQSETGMTGYRVYRNDTPEVSTAIQVTDVLIPATNTSSSHSYGFTDAEVSIGQTYYYWLEGVEFNLSEFYGPVSVSLSGNVPPVWPELTTLHSAYPNPFKASASTNIGVALKESESGTLTIYDIRGQAVRSFALRQGFNTVNWNGRDSRGSLCSSGIYFYRLSTPSLTQTRKLVLTK